jgi:hypothetical protein
VESGESPTSAKPIETTSTTAATVPTITAPTRPGRRRVLTAGSGKVCAAGSSGSNPGVSAPRCRPATAQERTETCAQVLPLHPSSHQPRWFRPSHRTRHRLSRRDLPSLSTDLLDRGSGVIRSGGGSARPSALVLSVPPRPAEG